MPTLPQTRASVSLLFMREMDTLPIVRRAALKGSRTNVIGILAPDLGQVISGDPARRGCRTRLNHLDLMLFTTHRTAIKEANYVANMYRVMVDGLLVVLPRNPADYTGTLTSRNFPFVLIDHQGTVTPGPGGCSNWQGAYNATEYLIHST